MTPAAALGLGAVAGLAWLARQGRARHLDRWLVPYLVQRLTRPARRLTDRHFFPDRSVGVKTGPLAPVPGGEGQGEGARAGSGGGSNVRLLTPDPSPPGTGARGVSFPAPRTGKSEGRSAPRPSGEVHLLLAIADHFEPRAGGASAEKGRARVRRWVEDYPRALGAFRDSDGRPPRHTFFYPVEAYEAEHLDDLAGLCRRGFGEVEVHLHHDDDTAEDLRATLLAAKRLLADRHGLLARDRATGDVRYGFVHGNWALDNSRPDGRHCGVNNELEVLRATGCYADFTLPSAPSPTQTRKINSIYYAVGDPLRSRSHDTGRDVGRGPAPERGLMLIQGPLGFDGSRRKWGVFPRLENGCVQATQPATIDRLEGWLRARVQVPTRPDWFFVKLHAHGAEEHDHDALLGPSMVAFHQSLARRAALDPNFHYHYVTARELYNLARAAESGWRGPVAGARDFELVQAEYAPSSRTLQGASIS